MPLLSSQYNKLHTSNSEYTKYFLVISDMFYTHFPSQEALGREN